MERRELSDIRVVLEARELQDCISDNILLTCLRQLDVSRGIFALI